MVLLTNVYIDVLRSTYTTSSGTDVPKPYLTHQEGHLTRIKDSMFVPMQASALFATYEVYVEPNVDIKKGDVITNIVRKDTGKKWFNQSDMETWRVLESNVSSPGFGEYRDVTLGRYVGGGPAQGV